MLTLSSRSTDKHSQSLRESIGACYIAMDRGKLEGKVTDRMVRATMSALEQVTPDLRIDHVPNPFKAPHNLSWYFGACVCPTDVRMFATRLRKSYSRVWSVAQDRDGWRVLAQVFGADNQSEAAMTMVRDCDTIKRPLLNYVLDTVEAYQFSAQNKEAFLHEHAKELLSRHGKGHFFDILLRRKP